MDIKYQKVAVIGAGLAGLTCAYHLAKKGIKVKVFEALSCSGGLARTESVCGTPLEVYYHHFFHSDLPFFELCHELGISDKIIMLNAKMGYMSNEVLYEFGTISSLFKFRPLSFFDKIRCIISSLAIKNEKSLEQMDECTACEWLLKHAGKNVFNVIWKPMLVQKFGIYYDKVPMAWIWRKVHVRMLAKKNMLEEEKLAYMEGSLEVLIKSLEEGIREMQGEIIFNNPVKHIHIKADYDFLVESGAGTEEFDMVISTIPALVLNKLARFSGDFNMQLDQLDQLGVICLILVLKEKLSEYYWLNIGDNSFPFGLIVEHTNFCKPEQYGGKHILYISKYFDLKDKNYNDLSDEQIKSKFLKHLVRINPQFNDGWIQDVRIFKEKYAQPIIKTNYLDRKPSYETPQKGFYWLSTNHIYPDDRGVNYSVKMATELSDLILQKFADSGRPD